jgi:hypothetical protein
VVPPPVVPPLSAQDQSATLTPAEQDLLAGDSASLFANAKVSSHKAFVVAAADVLASRGDLNASTLQVRIGNWSAPVAGAGLTGDESAIVHTPNNFTLDQIAATAGQSSNRSFVMWCAWYLSTNGRPEQAQTLIDMAPAQDVEN